MPEHLKSPRVQTRRTLSQAWSSRGRRSALVKRIEVCAFGLVAYEGLAGCASPGPYNPSHLAPPQLGQVQELCQSGMGIPAGISLSSDCVASLSSSAVALGRVRTMEQARRACLSKGLAPGQLGLSQCELTTVSQRWAPRPNTADVQLDTSGLQRPARSYYEASFKMVRRREQDACARLGYDPSYPSFAQCVARLDTALFISTHPLQ